MVRLAGRFGRYGYRQITNLLRIEGWRVNHKRVERIWRAEGLKVPKRQPKRGRLWLNDGSCIRLRPLYAGHVWSYDFVSTRTHDGRPLKLLAVLDEYMAIEVRRSMKAHHVLEALADLLERRSIYARTTARSSRPSSYHDGWPESVGRRSSSNPAVRGRTATTRASTASSETSSSTVRSSTRCTRRSSSSSSGDVYAIPFDRTAPAAANPRHRRPSSHHLGSSGCPSSTDRRWPQD